jgi:hypothetical protein
MKYKLNTDLKVPDNVVATLKISIRGINPPIWRRIEVPTAITLSKLHMVFQDVFGWTNSHLHSFNISDTEYGYKDEFDELSLVNEKGIKLFQTLKTNTPGFWYLYDFGDHWLHDVQIETLWAPREGRLYPICLDGARKCPPEDCGSTGGYQRMLEIIADPEHEEHEEMLTWLGGKYDPEEFDLLKINRKLKKYAKEKVEALA